MYDLFVRLGIFLQGFARAARDDLIGGVDVEDLHVLCVQHPENLKDVRGHLLKSLFTLAQGRFCLLSPRDVAEHGHMPSGQIVGFRRIFNEDRLAVASQNPRFSVFALAVEKTIPRLPEISCAWKEPLNRLTHELFMVGPK